jgi:hypothetical protein
VGSPPCPPCKSHRRLMSWFTCTSVK